MPKIELHISRHSDREVDPLVATDAIVRPSPLHRLSDQLNIADPSLGYPAKMNEGAYEAKLKAIDDRVSPQPLAPDARPPLMRDAANALRAAVKRDPRDISLVNERVLGIAADALRVVHSMAQSGELSPLPNPTVDRLPGLIHDFAPNIAGTWIGDDDPLGRYADELIGAAERYADFRSEDG